MQNKEVIFEDLGLIDYKEAWDYQTVYFENAVNLKIKNRKEEDESLKEVTKNYLLFCEHPHVYTLGKSGSEANLLISEAILIQQEATYYKINRGGDITYHGPGQLVGYPIFDLDHFFSDIHKYLRFLEEAVILTLKEYGVESDRSEGETGVWLDVGLPTARKICALGVKSSRWVTMHGFALNVNTDLTYFDNIVPCGIVDKSVTSLDKELGKTIDIEEVKEKLKKHLSTIFEFSYQ